MSEYFVRVVFYTTGQTPSAAKEKIVRALRATRAGEGVAHTDLENWREGIDFEVDCVEKL